jgi:penicillin-binding protein-related factor A (putative recombinase)
MFNIPEKTIENQILTWLFYKKIFAWKNQSVGVFDPKKKIYRKPKSIFHINGVSDIIGIYKGKALFIEVKSAKGRLRPDQIKFMAQAKQEGAICIVARSIEDVEKGLL